MGCRTTLQKCIALVSIAIALAVVGAGCGKPAQSGAEFVGQWAREGSKPPEIMLDLSGDGLGTSRFERYPNDQPIRWTVVEDRLVISAQDGTTTDRFKYRFDTPEHMVVTTSDGKEWPLVKVK